MAIQKVLSGLFVTWLSIASAYPTAEANPAEANSTIARRYVDGEGTYLTSTNGHRYASGVKCWTDWFVVGQGTAYGNWYQASEKVQCTGTSLCMVTKMTETSNCRTFKIGGDISGGSGSGGKPPPGDTEATPDDNVKKLSFNFAIKAGYSVSECSSASETTACGWNDGGCHVIWAQQQWLTQKGYARRRCHDKGKDYTAWMKNFEQRTPTSSLAYGCGSKCSDS